MFRKPKNIKDFMQPVLVVPEIMSANVLIKEFADKKRSVAVVVDEYGGTAGMITVEDLVEEVFGDIEDEYDEDSQKVAEEDMVFEKHEDGSLTIGARQNIFDLNENYELELPESEHYTTLGGLIMHQAGEIPTEGTVFSNIEPYYTFTILKATPTKILAVKVKKKTV
jgi:CBS domain containing-hemolysin-like protein